MPSNLGRSRQGLTTGIRRRQNPERNKTPRPDEHDNDGQSPPGVLRTIPSYNTSDNGTAVGDDGDLGSIRLVEELVVLQEKGEEILRGVGEEVETGHQADCREQSRVSPSLMEQL